MVLRVEDTDVERSEVRFEDLLIADLKWLGLDWDEGPDVGGPYASYRQSDRLEIYREHAARLLDEGMAYLCFCTDAELEQERQRAHAEHRQPIYSGKCRALDPAEAQRKRTAGEPCAIRLRIPEHPIRFHDIVHGDVEFSNEVVSDPIILRSSGMPVYNYVVVIDDALMKITHVIRGDDHLSNTPKQVALYEALGWPVPEFAHLSTILGSDRERLSKRHGATSIANFQEMGVLPEALMNYLALLGWAPSGGTREIFSKEELVKEFSLERVTPSAAIFDMEKLYWLNRHYIKEQFVGDVQEIQTANETTLTAPIPSKDSGDSQILQARLRELEGWISKLPKAAQAVHAALPYLAKAGYLGEEDLVGFAGDGLVWLARVVQLFILSVDRLDQLSDRASLIFTYDPQAALAAPDNAEVLGWPNTKAVIIGFTTKILEDESAKAAQLTPERFKQIVNEVKAETGAKGKELFHPIRLVVTGSHSGPEFDKLIPILEEGSRLALPKHVLSVCERVEAFAKSYQS